MAKIPFSIEYRDKIESGEYKVILDCGVEAEILAWDKPGEYPIVCMAKKDGAIPFRVDNNGKAYHFPEGANYSDLFLVTPEEELTEWQRFISTCLQKHGLLDCGAADRIAKECSAELLELARKELNCTIGDYGIGYKAGYIDGEKKGKADALKGLPRWKTIKKDDNAIVRIPLVATNIVGEMMLYIGENAISISCLTKLPGFKEDEE